jgi:hypothetical protein
VARQVRGQGRPPVVVASFARLVVGPGFTTFGPSFGAFAEAVLQGRVEAGAERSDLGEQTADQRLERRHVVGQRSIGGREVGVHAGINTASAAG